MTYLTPNFTLEEMVLSQTASRLGIDNHPSDQIVANLKRVCLSLEAVRSALGHRPVIVSSGYRCPLLNRMVHGAPNSAHLYGLAVDFTVPAFGPPLAIAKSIAASEIVYDQLIYEFGSWVHLGLAGDAVVARRQELTIFAGATSYMPWLSSA